MTEATAAEPRLSDRCKTTRSGGAPSTTCYRTLTLDDGSRLRWPWVDPRGDAKRLSRYLQDNGPVTVHSWRGTVHQIQLGNGHAYLEYDDAARWQRTMQAIWIGVGVIIAAAGIAKVGLELRRLRGASVVRMSEGYGTGLDGVCVVGGLLLLAGAADPRWWAVIVLGFLGVCAAPLGRAVRSGLRSNCAEPVGRIVHSR